MKTIIKILLFIFIFAANFSYGKTEVIDGNYILTSDKSVGNNDTLVIKGNLDIPDNKKLTINNNAVLRITKNLTVAARGTLELKNNSCLYVSGDLIQDGTSPLGWGLLFVTVGDVTNGNNTFIVIEGDYTIWSNDGDGKNGYLDPSKSTIYVFGNNDLDKVYNSSTVNKVGDKDDFIAEQHASSISEFLPIELVSFSFEDDIFIWETASETNNDYFVVEYSRNGKDWVECTEHIYSASDYGYTYTTVQTINTASSVFSYFRLKQVDLNGNYSYSDVIVSENKVCDPCSEKHESNKLKVKELGNRGFRNINGELIYCEGDNK